MVVIYLLCFILICIGIVLLLGLTPEIVTNDLMKLISPKQTLRDKAQIAKGRKKSRRLTKEILHIRDALEATGKSKQFTLSCAASVVLLVVGCILAVVIDNYLPTTRDNSSSSKHRRSPARSNAFPCASSSALWQSMWSSLAWRLSRPSASSSADLTRR